MSSRGTVDLDRVQVQNRLSQATSSAFAIFLVPALFMIVERAAFRWSGDKPPSPPMQTLSPAPVEAPPAPEQAAGSA
jgi:hypothetical protein